MNYRNTSNLRSPRGAALVELALVIPLSLLLAFGGFEIAEMMKDFHGISSLAKQAAKAAYTMCKDAAAADLSTCLESEADKIQDYLDLNFPELEVVVSMYRYHTATSSSTRVGIVPENGETDSGFKTKYDEDRVDSEVSSLDADKPEVVIAEMFLPFTSLGSFVARTFFDDQIEELYEVSIF